MYCVTISTVFMYVTATHGSMSQFEMKVYNSLHKPVSMWATKKNKWHSPTRILTYSFYFVWVLNSFKEKIAPMFKVEQFSWDIWIHSSHGDFLLNVLFFYFLLCKFCKLLFYNYVAFLLYLKLVGLTQGFPNWRRFKN